MNLLDRIFLAIAVIILAVVSFFIVVFSSKLINLQTVWTSLNLLYGRWEGILVGSIFFVVSIKFLLSGIKSRPESVTIIRHGNLGLLSISHSALESFVLKVTNNIEEIKDVKVRIIKQDEGISINLKLMLTPHDIIVPELMSKLQQDIKKFIESNVGIAVKEICINIENITTKPVSHQRVVR